MGHVSGCRCLSNDGEGEKLTGGAIKHWDSAMLKPNPFLRMMGRKTEMDVVPVMIKLQDKGQFKS